MAIHRSFLVLAGLAALGTGLYFTGNVDAFVENYAWSRDGHPGLPSCDSSHGQSDAKRAIDNSPFAKTYGIAVVVLSQPQKVSANAQKVECTASVILNSAKKGTMSYSFSADPSFGFGKYLVQAALDLPSFEANR